MADNDIPSQLSSGQSSGPSTDAHNQPVIDPTKNVLDLVEQAILRQDDLRETSYEHIKDILEERARFNAEERQHIRELFELRAAADRELRRAEANRIDAIRSVDVGAVAAAAQVQATQAQTLAGQVAASAEAMRNQVAATAAQGTLALAAALDPIQKAIDDLRRAQYEAQGSKTQVVESHASGIDSRGQMTLILSVILGLVTIIMAGVTIYALSRAGP